MRNEHQRFTFTSNFDVDSAAGVRTFYAQWGTSTTYKSPVTSKVPFEHLCDLRDDFLNDWFRWFFEINA